MSNVRAQAVVPVAATPGRNAATPMRAAMRALEPPMRSWARQEGGWARQDDGWAQREAGGWAQLLESSTRIAVGGTGTEAWGRG